MIPTIVLLLWQIASPGAAIEYRHLPTEIVSATVYDWTDAGPPVLVASARVRDGRALVAARPVGRRVVVLFLRRDGAYLLDGPFIWPHQDNQRDPDTVWRRTATGPGPGGDRDSSSPIWISADQSDTWPRCRWNAGSRWECWGIPSGGSGVLVQADAANIWWCAVQPSGAGAWRRSHWGRLVVVADPDGLAPRQLRLQAQRAVSAPVYRFKDVRLQTATLQSVAIVQLPKGSAWIAGADIPDQAWLSIDASDSAPKFIPLADLAAGSISSPEHIDLDPIRRLTGTVVAGSRGASGATVTLFRLIDPPPPANGPLKPRRVFAAETTADANGTFAFDTLGNAHYEILAWHPQFGHASVLLQQAEQSVTLPLEQPGTARGRVLVGGKPAAGVDVFSVPDQNAFSSADDPVDLKGGDGKTDSEGRFVVTLAASGGGELRIGGGAYPTRRVPLPRSVLSLLDLGDIELGAPLVVRVVLDRDPGCDLIATGPVGRLGLQIVAGDRTGPGLFRVTIPEEGQWQFGLNCGGTIQSLSPTLVAIGQGSGGKEIRLVVPQRDDGIDP